MRNAIRLIVMLFVASSISVQASAAKKSVQVGSFTVGGTNSFGTAFSWDLDASAITSCFGGVTWIVDGISHTFLNSAFGEGFVMCTLPLFDPPNSNTFGILGCDQNTPDCFSQYPTVVIPSCALRLYKHFCPVAFAYGEGVFLYPSNWKEVSDVWGEYF